MIEKLFEKFTDYKKSFKHVSDLFAEHKKLIKESEASEFKNLINDNLSKYKNSDTVFILGSGTTINDLTKEEWEIIKKNDSISFNLFLSHSFIPTYHLHELPEKNSFRHHEMDLISKILNERKVELSDVPIIFKYHRFKKWNLNKNYFPDKLKENIYLIVEILINSYYPLVIKIWLNWINWMYKFSINKKIYNPIIDHAGSASYVTGFAHYMGYKNIVLLGIELNNQNYFWDNPKFQNKYSQECINLRKHLQETYKVHVTADEEVQRYRKQISVEKYLYIFNDIFLKPSHINLYVGSKKSALYPKIPLYEFNKI